MDLKKARAKANNYQKRRNNLGYHFARRLGFDSYQPQAMMSWSEQRIREQAVESGLFNTIRSVPCLDPGVRGGGR